MAKKKVGRPSKIDTINLEQVMKFATLGIKEEHIAYVLDISEVTLNAYKKKYPEFLKSLKDGKLISDERVERSLFERATGYDCPEDKIFLTKFGTIKTVRTIKHYPPDTIACIYWLKNRKPKEWRDKIEVMHGLDSPLMEKYQNVSGNDLIKAAKELGKAVFGASGGNKLPKENKPS